MRIFGSQMSARASAMRCFCPPDSCTPRSPTTVSKPSGKARWPPRAPGPRARPRGSGLRLRRLGVVEGEADVARDGGREEKSVLLRVPDDDRTDASGSSHTSTPSMRTAPGRRGQQAREKHRQRRLARARAPDDRQRLARRDLERHVVEHRAVPVGERRCLHGQRAARRAAGAPARPVDDFGLRVEARRAGARSRAPALHDAQRKTDGDHRPCHAGERAPESEEGARREAPMFGPAQEKRRPVPEEHEDPDRGHRTRWSARTIRAAGRAPGSRAGTACWSLRSARARAPRGQMPRTTRTPARFAWSTSLMWPSAPGSRACECTVVRDTDRERSVTSGRFSRHASVEHRAHADHDLQRAREREGNIGDVEHAEAEEHADLLEVAGRAAHDLARGHLPVERRARAGEACAGARSAARTRRRGPR